MIYDSEQHTQIFMKETVSSILQDVCTNFKMLKTVSYCELIELWSKPGVQSYLYLAALSLSCNRLVVCCSCQLFMVDSLLEYSFDCMCVCELVCVLYVDSHRFCLDEQRTPLMKKQRMDYLYASVLFYDVSNPSRVPAALSLLIGERFAVEARCRETGGTHMLSFFHSNIAQTRHVSYTGTNDSL